MQTTPDTARRRLPGLSFRGRLARGAYGRFAGLLAALLVVAVLIAPAAALAVLVLGALPATSAAVRRLHDTGRSGAWLILPALVVPTWLLIWIASAASVLAVRQDPLDDARWFLGASVVVLGVVGVTCLWLAGPSDPGANRYGPNPNEVQT